MYVQIHVYIYIYICSYVFVYGLGPRRQLPMLNRRLPGVTLQRRSQSLGVARALWISVKGFGENDQ